MAGECGLSIAPQFRHEIIRRWRCDVCKRMELLDELELFVATVYDRGRFIVRACRQCQGKRRRLKWKEGRSLRRLEARIRRQGWRDGAERTAMQKRLGVGSCARESAGA